MLVQDPPTKTLLPPVAGEPAHATIKAWGGPALAGQPAQAPHLATSAAQGASTAAAAQHASGQSSKNLLVRFASSPVLW